MSRKLFYGLVVFTLIVILVAYAFWYRVVREQEWQETMANGFEARVNNEISQIYWSWQQQGRPDVIDYVIGESKMTFPIVLTDKGLPLVEVSQEACLAFVSMFLDDQKLKENVKVSTTYLEHSNNKNAIGICHYSILNKVFAYHVETGEFKYER
ncbi:hypothetical protein [Glaciecola sp. 1036]|uniref:hypothetical protein n=1 Tax=Alteromonadaceae TaxID=72275 RepID=UPI003D022FDC